MKRRHTPQEENLLARRLKLDRDIRRASDPMGRWPSRAERMGKPDHVSRKRHPLDCGRARCVVCSREKVFGHEETRQERRAG
jgi:hypothetical protein